MALSAGAGAEKSSGPIGGHRRHHHLDTARAHRVADAVRNDRGAQAGKRRCKRNTGGLPARVRCRPSLPLRTLFCVSITYTSVMAATNPFVYREMASLRALPTVRPNTSACRARPVVGPEGVPDFSAPLRQTLVRNVLRGLARGAHTISVTLRRGFWYKSGSSVRTRAPCVSADTPQSGLRRWAADLLADARHQVRLETGAGRDASLALSFPAVRTPKDAARLASDVFAMPERVGGPRGGGPSPSRWTSSRQSRPSTATPQTGIAPPCRPSARSATCSRNGP